MKKTLFFSMLISLATICSCQKQNSAAEQQLAQRKVELDAREEALAERKSALDEREKAVIQREKAVAEKEKAMTNPRTIPSGIQGQTPDPEHAKAERDSRLQQLPPEFRALVPDRAQMNAAKAEKDRLNQERLGQSQRGPEQSQRNIQRKSEAIQKWQMSGAAASPAAEVTSSTPSPAVEYSSPPPSPTPE